MLTPGRRVVLALGLIAASTLAGCSSNDGAGTDGRTRLTDADDLIQFDLAWQTFLPAATLSSPTVADWNSDGVLDVIGAMGLQAPAPTAGTDPALRDLFVLDGRDGTVLAGASFGGIDASPLAVDGDMDGDVDLYVGLRENLGLGVLENPGPDAPAGAAPTTRTLGLNNWVHGPARVGSDLVVVTGGSEEQGGEASDSDLFIPGKPGELLRLDPQSLEPLWRTPLPDESYSSPAIVDMQGSTRIVIGTGGQLHAGGGVHAFDAATGDHQWTADTATGVLASPAIAAPLERAPLVVVQTWWGEVIALDAATGTEAWTAQTHHVGWNSPALAHLNDDAVPDVIVTAYHTPGLHFDAFEIGVNDKGSLASGDGGIIAAYDGTNGSLLWQSDARGTPSGPVTSDLNGDGRADVVVVTTLGTDGIAGIEGGLALVLDGATGSLLADIPVVAGAVATPTVTDLDADGQPEIVLTTLGTGATVVLESVHSVDSRVAGSWPTWRGDAGHTGNPS